MKKVINGKVYNTETAEELHHWRSHHNAGDFGAYDETLYRTKKGNYFLLCDGGPLSPYSRPVGNNSRGGDRVIEPITRTVAIKWLEEHDGEEVIEDEFPDLIEEA